MSHLETTHHKTTMCSLRINATGSSVSLAGRCFTGNSLCTCSVPFVAATKQSFYAAKNILYAQ